MAQMRQERGTAFEDELSAYYSGGAYTKVTL